MQRPLRVGRGLQYGDYRAGERRANPSPHAPLQFQIKWIDGFRLGDVELAIRALAALSMSMLFARAKIDIESAEANAVFDHLELTDQLADTPAALVRGRAFHFFIEGRHTLGDRVHQEDNGCAVFGA
jgi:hypothetical protein